MRKATLVVRIIQICPAMEEYLSKGY